MQQMTLRQKLDFGRWLCLFPALSVMLLLRREIGYSLLNPLYVLGVSLVMAFVAKWLSAATPNAEALLIFAVVVFFGGVFERIKRWWGRRRGERVYSTEVGVSHLRRLWMPAFLKRERRVERFVDPLLCMAVGWLLLKISLALGGWFIFSGLALRAVEHGVWKRQIQRELDTVDSMLESDAQEEVLEHYTVRLHKESDAQADGIPTGYAADIEKTILRRKTKRAPRE